MRHVVPDDAREMLDASGLPWSIERGTRHFKIVVGGRLAAILPSTKPAERVASRAHKNMLAQIRRTIRSLKP